MLEMIAKDARIFIAGHRGMVGSAILRCFEKNGYHNLLTRTHEELDLRNESEVKAFYDAEKPEYVVIAAAKVGGIAANDVSRRNSCWKISRFRIT